MRKVRGSATGQSGSHEPPVPIMTTAPAPMRRSRIDCRISTVSIFERLISRVFTAIQFLFQITRMLVTTISVVSRRHQASSATAAAMSSMGKPIMVERQAPRGRARADEEDRDAKKASGSDIYAPMQFTDVQSGFVGAQEFLVVAGHEPRMPRGKGCRV